MAELKNEVAPALCRGVEIADSTQAERSGIRGRLLDKVSRIVYRGFGLADRARAGLGDATAAVTARTRRGLRVRLGGRHARRADGPRAD